MSYSIFLDDTRNPPENMVEAVVVRDYWSFCAVLNKHGCPSFISFDHDLGGKYTGMDCAKRLIHAVLDKELTLPEDFSFAVHSMNPAGAANIRSLMDQFIVLLSDERYGAIRQLSSEYGGNNGKNDKKG